MDKDFVFRLYLSHNECTECPSPADVNRFFDDLMALLFADFSRRPTGSLEDFQSKIDALKVTLQGLLIKNLVDEKADRKALVDEYFRQIPGIYARLEKDIEATYLGDPAANSSSEVIRSYPGFYAIAAYRLAHALAHLGAKNIPRIITENAHSRTGIDIHPKATIGEYFCIDHGTGVVIGETAIIGDHVKIYQGVTLGALSVNKEDAKIKRHPTIEDHVVLYAGATILGGSTTVGHHSTVGGNVWLTKSIPPYSRVYYKAEMHNDDRADLIIVKQD